MMLVPDLLGESDGGQRLEQREQRAAEESRLLSGDHGNGVPVAQLCRGRHGLGRGAAPLLLCLQDGGDAFPIARMRLRSSDGIPPCRRLGRVPREELGEPPVLERVILRQAPDPGKTTDVDGKPRG
jgi:hypothetical protein